MSHTASVKAIRIVSISALRAAVTEMAQKGIRVTLAENAKPRAYYDNQQGMGVAPYVLQLADAKYDVGIYPCADGNGYEARTDFFLGSVEKILGATPSSPEAALQAKMGRFFQQYSVCATEEAARKKGLMVRRMEREDGTVALELTGPSL